MALLFELPSTYSENTTSPLAAPLLPEDGAHMLLLATVDVPEPEDEAREKPDESDDAPKETAVDEGGGVEAAALAEDP